MTPSLVDTLFPIEYQRNYITTLQKRGGLTQRRAECFVRLWAYLLLKQQHELSGKLPPPLKQLDPLDELVACTHREAAELFYRNRERGSDRSAGMMIDQLVALGLLDKHYDGQVLCLQVRTLPKVALPKSEEPVEIRADAFNPRTDAISVAYFYTRNYAGLMRDSVAMSKVAKVLRIWAKQYVTGMRVLRRSDNQNVVAASVIFPVASESEVHFFQPPSKSFYLTTDAPTDPFVMAQVGDRECTSVYVRAWVIDQPYLSPPVLFQMVEDTQQTIIKMRQDYPEICDLYSMIVHPMYEELRRLLGFERICEDVQRPFAWIYLPIDRFLEINIREALADLRIGDRSQ